MRIYLIGLPGSGKTTLGKELAFRLGYRFIDMDEWIEQQAMLFIDELFDHYGEAYFRALETNVLKDLKEMDIVVIACGGGIVTTEENKKWMQGIVIYLTVALDVLTKRLQASYPRPLLKTKTIDQLLLERKDRYENFATFQIENADLEKSIEQIMKRLGDQR